MKRGSEQIQDGGNTKVNAPTQDTSDAQDMSELLDSVEAMKPLRRGDIVEGIVMRSDPEGVLVNIGHKAEGLVPPGEMMDAEERRPAAA